jgi:hypothetical protein
VDLSVAAAFADQKLQLRLAQPRATSGADRSAGAELDARCVRPRSAGCRDAPDRSGACRSAGLLRQIRCLATQIARLAFGDLRGHGGGERGFTSAAARRNRAIRRRGSDPDGKLRRRRRSAVALTAAASAGWVDFAGLAQSRRPARPGIATRAALITGATGAAVVELLARPQPSTTAGPSDHAPSAEKGRFARAQRERVRQPVSAARLAAKSRLSDDSGDATPPAAAVAHCSSIHCKPTRCLSVARIPRSAKRSHIDMVDCRLIQRERHTSADCCGTSRLHVARRGLSGRRSKCAVGHHALGWRHRRGVSVQPSL